MTIYSFIGHLPLRMVWRRALRGSLWLLAVWSETLRWWRWNSMGQKDIASKPVARTAEPYIMYVIDVPLKRAPGFGRSLRSRARCHCRTAVKSWGSASVCSAGARHRSLEAADWPVKRKMMTTAHCCSAEAEKERRSASVGNDWSHWSLHKQRMWLDTDNHSNVRNDQKTHYFSII